jgi:pimeloyl-ACP methyl ester carboxylesterase
VDITDHIGADCYSGMIFLGSTPFRSWDATVMHDWFEKRHLCVRSASASDLRSTAPELVGAFTHQEVPEAKVYEWIGRYVTQNPMGRESEELKLQDAANNTPVLVLLGEKDLFLDSEKMKEKYQTELPKAKVHIWPGVGHAPFFEAPEKTRDAILTFLKTEVQNVQLGSEFQSPEKLETEDEIAVSAKEVRDMQPGSEC